MMNIKFDKIEDYRDIETLNMYQKIKSEGAKANTGFDLSKARILIGNYTDPSLAGTLRPYEAVVLELI
jgi:hypothetical protein